MCDMATCGSLWCKALLEKIDILYDAYELVSFDCTVLD